MADVGQLTAGTMVLVYMEFVTVLRELRIRMISSGVRVPVSEPTVKSLLRSDLANESPCKISRRNIEEKKRSGRVENRNGPSSLTNFYVAPIIYNLYVKGFSRFVNFLGIRLIEVFNYLPAGERIVNEL